MNFLDFFIGYMPVELCIKAHQTFALYCTRYNAPRYNDPSFLKGFLILTNFHLQGLRYLDNSNELNYLYGESSSI